MRNLFNIFVLLLLLLLSFTGFAQQDLITLDAYWGEVTDLQVSKEQLSSIEYMSIHDTMNNRDIKYITKYKFYFQPAANGPVEVKSGQGVYLNQHFRELPNPQSGDKIVVSEIFGYVQNEGLKQIPTAIVLVIK